MRYTVGVADMRVARSPEDSIVTHALGSCLGVSAHDPEAYVGGMLHVMLPLSRINIEKARMNPAMFVDTAMPEFLNTLTASGAQKRRLVVKAAGCARTGGEDDRFAIGRRNFTVFKKLIWQYGVLLANSDVGGCRPRTMSLDIGTGETWISSRGIKSQL